MRLHRFFLDQNDAIRIAAERFSLASITKVNTVNGAVSQNGVDGGHNPAITAPISPVSQHSGYVAGDVISIPSGTLAHQIADVFRLKKGDKVILIDGNGIDYVSSIVSLADEVITFHVEEIQSRPFKPRLNVSLYAGIPKGDTFEWIVEKATELGVARIIPTVTERSEKKQVRQDRLVKIAAEASEQSGRTVMPAIEDVYTFENALHETCGANAPFDVVFVLDPYVKTPLREILQKKDIYSVERSGRIQSIAVFIGPEGGWSLREQELFASARNIISAALGETVLRAETACVAALSLLLL